MGSFLRPTLYKEGPTKAIIIESHLHVIVYTIQLTFDMMHKLILVLFVCILKTCAADVDDICCEDIKALVENKKEAFTTLCSQPNTLPPGCCDAIKKEVESFEDAYEALCLNKSGRRSLKILTKNR